MNKPRLVAVWTDGRKFQCNVKRDSFGVLVQVPECDKRWHPIGWLEMLGWKIRKAEK